MGARNLPTQSRRRSRSVTLALLPPTSRCLLFFCTHLGAASSHRSESAERPFKGTTQPSARPAFKRTPAVTGASRRSFHKSSYVTRFDNLASLWADTLFGRVGEFSLRLRGLPPGTAASKDVRMKLNWKQLKRLLVWIPETV